MKRISIGLMVMILLAAFSFTAAQNNSDFSKNFKVDPGGDLQIRTSPGEIYILTWSKNEVEIQVDGVDEENLENLEITESGNKIRVEFASEWGWDSDVRFSITIPEEFNVNAKTTGGEIEIRDNITGTVNLNSAGGNVTTADVTGDVDLSTSGGNIRTGSVSGNYLVSTMGGDIDAVNISGKKARVKTMGGDIELKNVKAELNLQTYGGDIEVGQLEGKSDLNTYGGNIFIESAKSGVRLNTYGGNIRVGNSESYVEAKTAGGNIHIKQARGHVRARTNAGNISVTLYPSGSESSILSTNSGEIELSLPSSAKVDIEAEIDVHGAWDEDAYVIESDFPSDRENDSYNESKRKSERSAKYTINGGGQKISLKAVNSDIKIKKIK